MVQCGHRSDACQYNEFDFRCGPVAQAEADDDPRRESVYPHLRWAPATARRGTDADHFTLGLRKRSFGIVMLLLALVAMAPGVSIVAGLLLMIPAFQMNAGQPAPVFPRRIAARPFSTRHLAALVPRAVPVLRYLEKVIHPRWPTPLEATKRLFIRYLCSDLGQEPIGVSAFDPIQNASSCSFERRHIFRKQ